MSVGQRFKHRRRKPLLPPCLPVSGVFDLVLGVPTFDRGGLGYAPVVIDATNYPWLQYDWNTQGQGPADALLPSQNATFGLHRGNDRVIYWRERF